MAGQTINDRFLAARHSLAGQGLAKSVCKATTEELIGPKKKHLDYLVQCTNEPNVSIPQLANLLIERSQSTNWVVVYKALVTVHHLMCFGNERFTQYLASSNSTFQLHNFFDKSGVQGYDMSPFIRKYSRYLNEKAVSYRTVAFDFCKTKRGKEDGTLRTMNAERLIKTLPTLQAQLDALLEFDCSPNDLNNGVINMCFMLLFKDLIRLFASYNDGIINLLEKFFDMNKKQSKDALDIYKKFLIRMDKVAEFLKVAENIGIDKGDIPDLTKAPSSLLDALEQHLASLEGKKSSTSSTPSQSVSSNFGNTNGRVEANGIDEGLKQKVLAEEEAAINQFKNKVQSPTSNNNPFLRNMPSSTSQTVKNINISQQSAQQQQQPPPHVVDFFSAQAGSIGKASEDLLQLNNPFADVYNIQPNNQINPVANAWINNGNNGFPNNQPQSAGVGVGSNGIFVSESNFQTVFGNVDNKAADGTINPSTPQSFNPFLVEDSTPPLLLDSPTENEIKPITQVLSFFQKDYFQETDSNVSHKYNEEKETIKTSVDEKFSRVNDIYKDNNTPSPPPPRPPPPTLLKGGSNNDNKDNKNLPLIKDNKIKEDILESTSNNDVSFSPLSVSINDPSPSIYMYTANEGLPVDSHNIATTATTTTTTTGFDALGGVLQPISSQQGAQQNIKTANNKQSSSALLTGDLETSLASLAENLSINRTTQPTKGIQWNSPKNGSKVANTWNPQPMSATTGAGYKPMNQALTNNYNSSLIQQQIYPQLQPIMGIRQLSPNANILPQMTAMQNVPNAIGQQQSLLFH